MKKSTIGLISASVLTGGALAYAVASRKKQQKEEMVHKVVTIQHEDKEVKVLEDTDMRNSEKIDQVESVEADQDPAEKGLTLLDSAYRAEWQANGFPQTHQEMKELEEEEVK
ncbi:hypothetical protein [Bacillus sp. FJAT-27251]|uniref:hypothetical protein n=1 Tax=Bacillus sp. FJAT-27251 TaxID=1684142 RepID=UPI0006A78232|nr:hypothetical protein [Bacillus sp. FJAT-27251]